MRGKRILSVVPAVLVAVVFVVLHFPASASHSPGHPCDLIVSTQGSDSNSGTTLDQPLRTVQELVNRLAGGQTGCLRATPAAEPFDENVVIAGKNASGGTESDRITIRSYPDEVAKVRGNVAIEDNANLISLQRLVLEGTSGGTTVRVEGDSVVLADNNVTSDTGPCLRVGVVAQANRVRLLRNRVHDCGGDAVNVGRSLYAAMQGNLLYDSDGTAVRLTADADGSYLYRNIIDGNGEGVTFNGAGPTRFADSNFVDSNIIANSTGSNVGYNQMSGSAGNFVSQACVYSSTSSNGGLQTSPAPQGYQVWGPALHVESPSYEDRPAGDFGPTDPGSGCFRSSGDVAGTVELGGGASDEQASAANTRPNILFIVTDDQRADGTVIPEVMPETVSQLVNRGVNYTNAYGTTPLCCPARASIMTGQYSHNHDVLNGLWAENLNQDTTLQAYLKAAPEAYRTAIFGKFLNEWDLDLDPAHWDRWSVLNDSYCPFIVNEQGTRKRYPPIDPSTGGPPAGECDPADLGRTALAPYVTDYLSDLAVDFIDEGEADDATDDQPWFMYVAPTAPHFPYEPEADHANDTFPPFESTPATFEDTSDKPQRVRDKATTPEKVFGDGTDPGERVQQLRTLRSVDDMIGRLLEELRRKGEQDTMIVFIGDNGFMWGDHGLSKKGWAYDAGIRIPMVVRYSPVTAPGTADNRLVANIDLAPTALELAGVEPPPSPPIDGQSLFSETTTRQRIHTEFNDHGATDFDWAATRAPGDYAYIETYADDGETIEFREYYDLAMDPYELTNLFGADGVPGTGDDLGSPDEPLAQLHDQLRRDRMCKGIECPPGPGGGTADPIPPRTLITGPGLGSTVCCRVRLEADASDNIEVERVEFEVDGNPVGTDLTEPFSVIWDTAAYAGGPHTIGAYAVDSAGNRTVAGSSGSTVNVDLDLTGTDIQIDDGGVPRTNCGSQPSPCNVGSINAGDLITFTFPEPVAPGELIPGWDGTEPATCSIDPVPPGCVTVGVKADSLADQNDTDTAAIYSDLAGTSRIAALGDLDLGDDDYITHDAAIPFRTWSRSKMLLTNGDRTVQVMFASGGTGSPGDGQTTTVKWSTPACGCEIWESIDGADTDEDREF